MATIEGRPWIFAKGQSFSVPKTEYHD